MPYKGIFKPINLEKYIGDPSKIIYRSLWERSMMKYFDNSKNIISWSSEECKIPYFSPKDSRQHFYFPDFVIYAKTKTGEKKVTMIEVKPQKQTIPPKVPKRKTKKYFSACMTYAINIAKWKAAETFCESKGWDWKIMTEKNIYG